MVCVETSINVWMRGLSFSVESFFRIASWKKRKEKTRQNLEPNYEQQRREIARKIFAKHLFMAASKTGKWKTFVYLFFVLLRLLQQKEEKKNLFGSSWVLHSVMEEIYILVWGKFIFWHESSPFFYDAPETLWERQWKSSEQAVGEMRGNFFLL